MTEAGTRCHSTARPRRERIFQPPVLTVTKFPSCFTSAPLHLTQHLFLLLLPSGTASSTLQRQRSSDTPHTSEHRFLLASQVRFPFSHAHHLRLSDANPGFGSSLLRRRGEGRKYGRSVPFSLDTLPDAAPPPYTAEICVRFYTSSVVSLHASSPRFL